MIPRQGDIIKESYHDTLSAIVIEVNERGIFIQETNSDKEYYWDKQYVIIPNYNGGSLIANKKRDFV